MTPLHYASCPLTPTQVSYAQIDREALSIYWTVKRFHLFVYGKEFKVITDHKPLVSLFNNPSSKPSARIERWLLELQQYRFNMEYRPGASNPADYASRHLVGDPESHSFDVESEEHISFVARNAVPKAVILSEIESATAKDSVRQCFMSAVKSGCWHKAPPDVSLSELSRYEQVKEQLTCTDTGVFPAVLLLKRPVRNKLPQANHIDPVAEIVRERDSSQKLKMKAHADNKAYVKPCNISPGEAVLVKRPFSVSKGGAVYDPTPMTVVSKKGSMITAKGENRTVTRNSPFFKNVYQPAVNQGNDESQNIGFGSSADKECIQEPPPALESSNVPGPDPSDPPNTQHVKADLPSSSNLVPVPMSQTQTIHHRCADHPGREFPERFWTYSLSLSWNCGLKV